MANQQAQALAIEELKRRGVGVAENIATIGSSIIAEPIAGLSGLLAMPLGHERATGAINKIRDNLTYQPRTQEGILGQEFIADKSKYLNYPSAGILGIAELATGQGMDRANRTIEQTKQQGAGSVIAGRTYDATGSPLAASLASGIPTAVGGLLSFKGAPKFGKRYDIGDIKSGGSKQKGAININKKVTPEMQLAKEELQRRGVPPEDIWGYNNQVFERGSPEFKAITMAENYGMRDAKKMAKSLRDDFRKGEDYIIKDPKMGEEYVSRFESLVNEYKKGKATKNIAPEYVADIKNATSGKAWKGDLYHQTDGDFKKFDFSQSADNSAWFVSNLDEFKNPASSAHAASGNSKIVRASVDLKRVASEADLDRYSVSELMDKGFDGAVLDGVVQVFDSNAIKKLSKHK